MRRTGVGCETSFPPRSFWKRRRLALHEYEVSAVEVKTHLTRVSTSVVEGMEVRERARVFGLRACAGRIPGIWSNYATQQNASHSFLFQPMLCMLGQLGSPASPEGGVSRAEDGGRART